MESLGRQTVSHVYPLLGVIWVLSLLISVPVAIAIQSSQYHCPSKMIYGCVEMNWASFELDTMYTTGLFVIIVLIPSVAMATMYYYVAKVLAHSRVQTTLRVHCSVRKGQQNTISTKKSSVQMNSASRSVDFDNNVQREIAQMSNGNTQPDANPEATVETRLVHPEPPSRPDHLEVHMPSDDVINHANVSGDESEGAVMTTIEVTTVTAVRTSNLADISDVNNANNTPSENNTLSPIPSTSASTRRFHRNMQRSMTEGDQQPLRGAPSSGHPGLQRQQSVSELLMKSGPTGVVNWRSRLVYMLIVIVVGHVACWGPIHLMQVVLRLSSTEFQASPFVRNMMSLAYFLENISGCINPIAFCFMSQGFRATFISLFNKIKNFRSHRRP